MFGLFIPCFLAYSILLSFMPSIYSLLNLAGFSTVTITTGGDPEGMPSPLPKSCDIMNTTAPTAHAHIMIACTLLRRRNGYRADRVAYGGGFEDFLVGSAKCIVRMNAPSGNSMFVSQRVGSGATVK